MKCLRTAIPKSGLREAVELGALRRAIVQSPGSKVQDHGLAAFEVIVDPTGVRAFLVKDQLTAAQTVSLVRLAPDSFRASGELPKRWGLNWVLCHPDWESEQRRRKPMFRPSGVLLGFLQDNAEAQRREGAKGEP